MALSIKDKLLKSFRIGGLNLRTGFGNVKAAIPQVGQRLAQRGFTGNIADIGKYALQTPQARSPLIRNYLEGATRAPASFMQGLTYGMAPKTVTAPPKTLGGTIGDIGGQMYGFTTSPITKGIIKTTNPLAQKAVTRFSPSLAPIAGRFAPRIAAAGANVAQGLAFDVAGRTKTTPLSVGLDVATGLIGGPGQFGKAMGKGMGNVKKPQLAMQDDDVEKVLNIYKYMQKSKPTIEDMGVMSEEIQGVINRVKNQFTKDALRDAKTFNGQLKLLLPYALENQRYRSSALSNVSMGVKGAQPTKGDIKPQSTVGEIGTFEKANTDYVSGLLTKLQQTTDDVEKTRLFSLLRKQGFDFGRELGDITHVPAWYTKNTGFKPQKISIKSATNQPPPVNPFIDSKPQSMVGGRPSKVIQATKQAGKTTPPQPKLPTAPASTTAKTQVSPQAKSALQQANQKVQKSRVARPLDNIVNNSVTDVKSKVGVLDYLRTPDRVLKKIGLEKESQLIRQKYDDYLTQLPKEIDRITNWSKQVSPESNQRIFKYLDGQKIKLTGQEMKVASEVKSYLADWATKLKLPKDKQISNYITHIFEKDFIKKEFDPDIAKLIQNRVAGSVYDPFLEKRLGKMGYVEDTWRALDAYVKRATRKFHMDQALGKTKEAAKKLETSQYDYVKNYVDRINLRPTKLDNLVDNTIKQLVGYKFGQRPTAYLTKTGRQAVYRGTLGLNFGSALKNLSQGANTYAVLGEKYTVKGYLDLVRNGTDELEQVGVLRNNFIEDRTLSSGKQFLQTVDKGLFYFFEFAEKINRGSAYYGAKAKALAKGLDEKSAIDYAKKVVRDTQFTFGSVDTPVAMQSDIVKLLTQFQSYTVKQGEFLGEMIGKKDLAGLLRYGIAGMSFVYGAGKLIGMKPKDLIPSLRIGLPPTIQAPVEIAKTLVGGKDKWGNELDTREKLMNVGNTLIPFIPAGVQAKKTIGGLGDVSRGYSQSASGRVRYPVEQTTSNYMRGGMFGNYQLPEAQEYRKEGRSPLGEAQSTYFKESPNKQETYQQIINTREQNNLIDKVKEALGGKKEVKDAKKAEYTLDGVDYSGYSVGDRFIYMNEDGEVKTKSIKSIEKEVIKDEKGIIDANYSLMSDRLKRSKNTRDWRTVTQQYVDYLKKYQKKLDPKKDAKDIISIQNKIEDLENSLSKSTGSGTGKKTISDAQLLAAYKKALSAAASPSRRKVFNLYELMPQPQQIRTQPIKRIY